MRKLLLSTLLILLVLTLYLLFYPVSFEPAAFTPPKNPGFEGVFSTNRSLEQTDFLLNGLGFGPEDIAIGPDSMLYTGFEDGRIVKFSPQGKLIATLGNTLGRPLGMKFDKSGMLIIADEYKGLISMNQLGVVTVLTDEVADTKINFADDLDITEEGVIYFSDASQRNHSDDIFREFWELQPTGRLLSYHPETQETKLELSGLRFANGIALGPQDEFLLITETVGMQIMKFWLKGPKKGQAEVFLDQLPGYPDNINFNGDNIFWLGLTSARNSAFEELYDKPFLRKVIARLPESISKGQEVKPMGLVVGINPAGEVLYNFQSPEGYIHDISSAIQIGDLLYLGNIGMSAVGRFRLPE